MSTPPPAEATVAQPPRRVHWMELFFDLIFVAFIGQLAHGLHGEPAWPEFIAFVGLYFPAWWAWVNMTITINLLPNLRIWKLSVVMFSGMVCVGLMAAAVPEGLHHGEFAWAYAIGCAGMRLVLLLLWIYRSRGRKVAVWRLATYNGVTAAVWIASIWIPQPGQFFVWAAIILLEIVLNLIGRRGFLNDTVADMNQDHLAERLGLFMIIVMGESVLSLITGLSSHWTVLSAVTAFIGFLATALVAWSFFIYGIDRMEEGLRILRERGNAQAIRDTVMYLPYLLVVGITMIAAGLATSVEHPEEPLALGSSITLGGGLVLFYITNTAVAVRYGASFRSVANWAIPGILIALILIPLGTVIPALASVICVFLFLCGMVTLAQSVRRRRLRSEALANA